MALTGSVSVDFSFFSFCKASIKSPAIALDKQMGYLNAEHDYQC
jgi:hypothetical protein